MAWIDCRYTNAGADMISIVIGGKLKVLQNSSDFFSDLKSLILRDVFKKDRIFIGADTCQ